MRTCFHCSAHFQVVVGGIHRKKLQPGAIQTNIQFALLGISHNRRRILASLQADFDHVFRIQRELVPDRNSPARTDRQIGVLAFGLNRGGMNRVIDRRLTEGRIAHRQTADAGRRGNIFLQQHRRNRQHIADVVETVSGIIGRQKQGGIDLERNQIANRVGILRTIEPIGRRTARIGLRFCGLIKRRFQVRHH